MDLARNDAARGTTYTDTRGNTLAREIARVHAARLVQGFWGKPITHTLLKATTWDGTTNGLRDVLAHYRSEFSRESDRHKVGNAHLGRLEIWSGSRWWPQAADAWRWGYKWAPDSSGRLVGSATIEANPGARTAEMYWWIIAALLDYRPILDATTSGKLTEWAPEILERIADVDALGGLGGITVDWIRAALKEALPDVSLAVPPKVTEAHVRTLYTTVRSSGPTAAILANEDGDVRVGQPRPADTVLYTGQEMSDFLHGDLDEATPDPTVIKCLTTGIGGRLDGIPGAEVHLTEPCRDPSKLWDERGKLAEAFQAYFDGRDLVLSQDHAYRYRLTPAAVSAERGWSALNMDLVLARGRVRSEADLWETTPGGEVKNAVYRTAEMIGNSYDMYWKTT